MRLVRFAAVLFATSVLLSFAVSGAGAKVLPAQRVTITTAHPVVGRPIEVELRIGIDLGDFAWENSEVFVLPAARTGTEGWPADANATGQLIALRRFARGVYRGTFVAPRAGGYFVIDRSSAFAHSEPSLFPDVRVAPVRIIVANAAPSPGTSHARGNALRYGLLVVVLVAAMAFVWGFDRARARRRVLPSQDVGGDRVQRGTGFVL